MGDDREWMHRHLDTIYGKIDKTTADLAETNTEVAVMNKTLETFAVSTKQDLVEIKQMISEKQAARNGSSPKPPNLATQALSFLFSGKGVAVVIVALVLLFLNGDLAEVLSKILEK